MSWKERAQKVEAGSSWKDRAESVATPQDEIANVIRGSKEKVDAEIPGLLSGKFRDTGRVANSPGEYLDSVIGAPVRTAILEAQDGNFNVPAIKKTLLSIGSDPKNAPTGVDIASKATDNPYLGAGLATAVDIGAQVPLAEAVSLGSKGAALGGEKLGSVFKNLAESRAFKALGPTKKFEDAAQSRGLVNQIGRQALDEKVVSPLASKKTMLGRAEVLADQKTETLNNLLSDISNNKNLTPEQIATIDESKFNPAQAGNILKNEISSKYQDLSPRLLEGRTNQIDDFLGKDEPFDIVRAQNLKKQMKDFISDSSYWKNNPSASQEGLMKIRSAIKGGIEKNADAYAKALGEQGGQVKDLNRSLGNSLEMSDILADRVSRDAANHDIGLGDKIMGLVGEHAAGPAGLLGIPASMFMRSKGNQLAATGADSIAKMLLENPTMRALAEKDPDAFQNAVAGLAKQTYFEKAPAKAADTDQKKGILTAQ